VAMALIYSAIFEASPIVSTKLDPYAFTDKLSSIKSSYCSSSYSA